MSDIHISVEEFTVSDMHISVEEFTVSDMFISVEEFTVSDMHISANMSFHRLLVWMQTESHYNYQ